MRLLAVPPTDSRLRPLRSQYLDSLPHPQDMHSESLTRSAKAAYLFLTRDQPAGYCLLADDGTLVEFCVPDPVDGETAFDDLRVTKAICKSFDGSFLSLCTRRSIEEKTIALLFTEAVDFQFQERPSILARPAGLSDLPRILEINDGFFDSSAEVEGYIERRHLHLYEESSSELLGCGLVQPVMEGRLHYDLGMLVNPTRRREGIGEYIVRHLKADCIARGLRPVCCCDVENTGSVACLKAAGFRSTHRTLEFRF